MTARTDSGGIVIGWLTRVVIVLALAGLVAFDAIAVVAGRVGAADDAGTAASAASSAWRASHDIQTSYDAAVAALGDKPTDTVLTKTFHVDPDGTVHLQVRREITTLLLRHVGPLRAYTIAVENGQARDVG